MVMAKNVTSGIDKDQDEVGGQVLYCALLLAPNNIRRHVTKKPQNPISSTPRCLGFAEAF